MLSVPSNAVSYQQDPDANEFAKPGSYTSQIHSELQHTLIEISGLEAELDLQSAQMDRYRSEIRELRCNQIKYKELFKSAPIGYLIVDKFQQVKEINPVGAELLGKRTNQITRAPLPLLVASEDRDLLRDQIETVCKGAKTKLKAHIMTEHRGMLPVMLYLHPIRDLEQRGFNCQIAMMDISEHHETEEQLRNARDYLQHVATHDALTGLPNRRYFNDALESSLIAARRQAEKVAVVMMDLDKFKMINDTLGHDAGDQLLVETAKRLQGSVRKGDLVARMGGDEFTLVLSGVDQMSTVEKICENIRLAIAEPFQLNGNEVCSAASLGVCMYPTDSVHSKELLKFADAALYRAKSSGRNCVNFFTPDLSAELSKKFRIESDLRTGIKQDDFEVWYQPIKNLSTGAIVSVEALARWRHPKRGMVSPIEFITVAEECGAIEQLGYVLLEKACKEIKSLHNLGYDKLTVAVNLSPRQLVMPDFSNRVKDILDRTKVDAQYLEFEVTENAVFHDNRHSMEVMNELRSFGIRFSIDDFGTGYSSLARLRRLPVSKIKIDQSFVRSLPHDTDGFAITKAIVSMANDLGLDVVCEGVETHAQLQCLVSLGCKLMQGYLIGEPMPPSVLANKLVSVADDSGDDTNASQCTKLHPALHSVLDENDDSNSALNLARA